MKLTVQCGVVKLTKRKKEILDREYDNLQRFLKGDKTVPLYSANKQQAQRYYAKVKRKEYPLSLRNDLINLRRAKAFWFLKVPVHGARGGIRMPIKPHREIPMDGKLCESKLARKNDGYIAMLTFEIPAPPMRKCSSILAVDLGERFTAAAVLLRDGTPMKPKLLGGEIRGIRRHYARLRKRLQEKRLLGDVKRVGDKERRSVNAVLHRVSKEIVSLADSSGSYIVLGDLTGIRQRANHRGRRSNRIASNIPYHRLAWMIEYKAMMRGMPVVTTSEAYTSRTCHRCGCRGRRGSQGLFVCPVCGEYNADLNGAINIGRKFERALGCMPFAGAAREPAHNGSTSPPPEAPCDSWG